MPGKKDAEYWRNYRAQRAARTDEVVRKNADLDVEIAEEPIAAYRRRIAELEEEVRQLKRQLALRGTPVPGVFGPPTDAVSRTYTPVRTKVEPEVAVLHQFGAPRPAPKPGKR